MGVTIGSNIFSLSAQRNLANATSRLSKTFERLSSGLRINSASDDPAGLAVADGLRADARVASVAIRNANDGLSITNVADAALSEISSILTRLAELAEQSANGVYSSTQRSALSSEFIALGSEIERIAATTEFNGVKLLSGSGDISLQVGLDGGANSRITMAAVQGTLAALGLGTAGGALSFSIIAGSDAASISSAQNALDAVTNAIASLSAKRGTIGATQGRLEVAVNNLQIARENFIAAESAIRDADIAQEAAELTRLQILQQAAAAVLAQANQQPQIVLSLLQ